MKAKEEYWEELFKGYESSGLSQEAFCSEQGIPIAKFKYQWRKKIESGSHKADAQNKSERVSEKGNISSSAIFIFKIKSFVAKFLMLNYALQI